jgi:hypothetical protein
MKKFAIALSLFSFIAFLAITSVNAQEPVKTKEVKTEKVATTDNTAKAACNHDAAAKSGCAKSCAKPCTDKAKADAACCKDGKKSTEGCCSKDAKKKAESDLK